MIYEKVMNTISLIPLSAPMKLALLFVSENVYNFISLKNVNKFEECHFYDKISEQTSQNGERKVCIVTGGNGGIGYETSFELAKLGYKVILACRSMDKAKSAIEEMKTVKTNIDVEALQLDLSDFDSIKKFVTAFKSKNIALDLFINNGAVLSKTSEYMTLALEDKEEEIEKTIVTNYLGPFLLTTLLLENITKSKGKIINVSSLAHYASTSNIDFTNNYDPLSAYCHSKLYLNMFTYQLKTMHPDLNIYCCHPGIIKTELYREMKGLSNRIDKSNTSKNAITGALTTLFLALVHSEDNGNQSLYFFDETPMTPSRYCLDRNKQDELYENTKQFLMLK